MVDLQKASLTTNGQQVTLTMPISKVDVEKRIVSGFATLDNVDRHYDDSSPWWRTARRCQDRNFGIGLRAEGLRRSQPANALRV